MKTLNSIVFVLLLAIVMQACNTSTADVNKMPLEILPVKTMSLEVMNVNQSIQTSGQFTTEDEAILSFKTGGIINKIYVKEGDAVKKGQLLATVNSTELNSGAEQSKLGFEKAQRNYKRISNLYRDSVATLEQFQNAKTELDIATQQLKTVNYNKDQNFIRANRDGFILRKLGNEGQLAGPGTPVLETNGAHQNSWILKTGVDDSEWGALKIGDKASITTDALKGQVLQGYVSRKSEAIDPQTGTFTIHLAIDKYAGRGLAAGLFGKAEIYPSSKSRNWKIPYEALLDGDGDQGYVFITNDNKQAQKVKVKIAKITSDDIWISSGLENAKSLIISGNAYLRDQSLIQVKN